MEQFLPLSNQMCMGVPKLFQFINGDLPDTVDETGLI